MISENLMKLRLKKEIEEQRKLPKTTVSKELNLENSTYGKWENGDRLPDALSLKKLANYFNVSIDYLLDNETSLCNESMEINKAMANVDISTRKRMVDTLKSAFPHAFDEYEWALNVLKANNLAVYTQLKEGVSELSETDIINMAKTIEVNRK